MSIEKIGLIGAGTMGSSIAYALTSKGFLVKLIEATDEYLASGREKIERIYASQLKRGVSQDDINRCKQLLEYSCDYSILEPVDLVIEAVAEDITVKSNVFSALSKVIKPSCIIASNTSSLSISQLASFSQNPQNVLGMHFFNPAHIMKLVEVIPGLDTSKETVNSVLDLTKRLGKTGVRVEECASFLVNRLLGRYMNESIWALFYSSVDIETLDKEVCSFNMPIGPLALRDMNGADIGLSVAEYNYREYGPRFLPPPLLAEMVKKSILGRKSSAGFYLYDGQNAKPIKANPAIDNMIATMTAGAASASLPNGKVEFEVERLFLPMINEAFLVLQEKIVCPNDLDPALKAGLGMRKGPLELASEIGLADCLKMLERDFERFGERFRPAPLLKRYVWAKRKTII